MRAALRRTKHYDGGVRSLVALGFAFASWVSASTARAEAPLRVELHVDACVDVSADEVRRITAIELRATVDDPAAHDARTTRVDVACVAGGVELRVLDPLTAKSLARAIALGDVATNARARLLALAIAELVSASWSELDAAREPVVPPLAPPPRDDEKRAARAVAATRLAHPAPAPPVAWRLTATFDARWLTIGSDPMLGVGARVGAEPFGRVGFVFDFAGEHASTAAALGTVGVDSYSLGAAALVRADAHPLVLRGGAGVRLGVAHMVGLPDPARAEGHAVTGVWSAPIATGSAGLRIARGLVLELALEAGYVVLPVRGVVFGGPDVRVDGFFVGGGVGLGVEL